MIKSTLKRDLVKSFSWRFISAFITFVTIAFLSNFFTALSLAGLVGLSDFVFKIFLYYYHERIWAKNQFGLILDAKEGACIWMTGLPCSGKTTIAVELSKRLEKRLQRTEYLDGDIVRKSLCSDLGFSKADRDENIKRITLVASYLAQRAITICAFVSPYREARAKAKKLVPNFIEVYVQCSLDTCIKRDVKGMYAKALKGELKGFTGIDDPYEEPESPDIICNTEKETVDESVNKIMTFLTLNKFI